MTAEEADLVRNQGSFFVVSYEDNPNSLVRILWWYLRKENGLWKFIQQKTGLNKEEDKSCCSGTDLQWGINPSNRGKQNHKSNMRLRFIYFRFLKKFQC